MMIHKTSGAYITRPSATELIRLVGYANPEIILPGIIRKYFEEVGYMSMYPYFKSLRIGSIHPFAMLLYQETTGQNLDVSLFPSITIADTSDAEVYDTLGREHEDIMLGASEVALLKAAVASGEILTSSQNIVRMEDVTKDGNKINGVMHTYNASHNIDLNIWGDNKDMVSLIYDLLKHCVLSNISKLHEQGIAIEAAMSGRRSGDINVEFGKLLYGANVTIPAVIKTKSMVIDLPVEEISAGGIETTGNYSVLGGSDV